GGVVGEVGRVGGLGEGLLMTPASGDPDFARPEPVALDRFTIEAFGKWMPTAQRRWTLGHLDPVLVTADRERLGLAVDALLENAVRHTADGEEVRLSVLRDRGGGTARMIVADGGEGIRPGELDRIFDRFRSGSQLGGAPGTGPGLGLVRAGAPRHGGQGRAGRAPADAAGGGGGRRVPRPRAPGPGAAGPDAEPLATPDAGRAVPSDALGAGSRPAYAADDPGPPGQARTTVEEL